MLKRFTTKELIFIALLAALMFIINMIIGASAVALTGLSASATTVLTNLIITTFLALTLRKYGSLSLLMLIYTIMALPTTLAGGPPGFIWKIPLILVPTMILELILALTDYKPLGFIIGLPIFIMLTFGGFILVFWWLGMPELQRMLPVIHTVIIAEIVLGYIGMWLGFALHKRLKNKRVIKQITS